ncbi:cytochrome c oxidase subunit CcoM [Aestuariirhabdus litorea]|uniref:cytochrome c oxidase subunit CcoM n=1 Tax=Aestuariirhabdus litorea TaxID=2528527 RepID=UPI000F617359|nr:cytochrome c oxidase subunit CcoM [Aestuariirhabdus litorea]RWW97428.1 hypothetical protein DZC74_03580 [Endozoicomonadaceae bacterium GTF-13]
MSILLSPVDGSLFTTSGLLQGVATMFLDEVVFAGLLTVGLMITFFAGLYYFLRKDMDKHP